LIKDCIPKELKSGQAFTLSELLGVIGRFFILKTAKPYFLALAIEKIFMNKTIEFCPYCQSKDFVKRGLRKNKLEPHVFDTPKVMGLEDALEYIGDDELVEVTPKNIRIRKVILDENEEKKRKKGILK